ncbi:hypothetical protein OGZ37_13035 [Lactococcus lactis]|uniref:hypothetical protein n=1 Tax=Lactococcus lactis TaxID=1358 RepID=UPI00241875F0|nr:hypothetical protein [Lactococcus lactis]MDG4967482.1 hypothetical protein [Lactococcus lactis]
MIFNFMHKGDQISSWSSASKYGTAIYTVDYGDGSILSGHMLESYHPEKDGSIKDINGKVWTSPDKESIKTGLDVTQKSFKLQMSVLKDLRSKLTASGGGLSSGEKIYLDSAQALAIVSTASAEFDLAMINVMKVYQDGIRKQEELWQKTLDKARSMGSLLESWEINEALESTGFTHENIVAFPVGQYQNKISKVQAMSEQFKSLENEIKGKISELVARDSELAQQLKG